MDNLVPSSGLRLTRCALRCAMTAELPLYTSKIIKASALLPDELLPKNPTTT